MDSVGRARRYGPISPALREQLLRVEPTTDGTVDYRPCRVALQDGRTLDRVYVQEARAYIRMWGVWPEDDRGKRSLPIEEVARIEDSPTRLPAHLANKMYAAGESGMGYCLFTLVLTDGRRLACVTGNAVDFVDLPPDVRPRMITDLLPHVGRDQTLKGAYVSGAPYYWCLYREQSTDQVRRVAGLIALLRRRVETKETFVDYLRRSFRWAGFPGYAAGGEPIPRRDVDVDRLRSLFERVSPI